MADKPEQLTSQELRVLNSLRKLVEWGHGELKVTVHRGQVTDIVKSERDKLMADVA